MKEFKTLKEIKNSIYTDNELLSVLCDAYENNIKILKELGLQRENLSAKIIGVEHATKEISDYLQEKFQLPF